MSSPLSFPDYTEIANALKKTPSKYNAAQVHGLFCGLICTNKETLDDHWKKTLLGNEPNPEVLELLQNLFDASYRQMNEFSFEFNLLLPDDDNDINERAEALGLWCQGFLTGLEQNKAQLPSQLSAEATDTLKDLTEISQVNYGDIIDTEEDETAYFELVEYIRLAALMIYHELNPDASHSNNQLH